jgi:LemA protein
MKVGLIVVVILVILALILGGSFVGRRNQMAVKREAVNASWAQVDVVLQRRADLIPNLVGTVKGFAQHEEKVFGDIAAARSALIGARTPADKIAANGALDSALSRLLVITENYPQLRSNENFLRLQDELAGTENRIAVERRRYNETVQDYNTYISLFPNSLVASFAGFTRNDAYFKTDEGARTAPKVDFDFNKAAPTTATPAPARP